jgi:ribosome biogenesis SPOUT family RNA methylase Rps3
MTIYIIEHLEPELWEWCALEYEHISQIVGKENLWFTNVKEKSKNAKKLEKLGKVFVESVSKLNLTNACVLDPEAGKMLEPGEAGKFDYMIFGGILGDYPPRKRTKQELTSRMQGTEARNIGKEQMSTDNAVYAVKQIAEGKKLFDLKFQDEIEIKTGEKESVILPYRYVLINGKPLISKKLVEYLKNKKGF